MRKPRLRVVNSPQITQASKWQSLCPLPLESRAVPSPVSWTDSIPLVVNEHPLNLMISCVAIPPQMTAPPISRFPFCVVSSCANAAFLYSFLISGITPSTCSASLMNKKSKQRVTVRNAWPPHPQICPPPAVEQPNALRFCRRSRTSGQDQQSPVTA